MSDLGELIASLCPDGVEFAPLSRVAAIRTGQRPTNEMLASGGPASYFNGGTERSGAVPAPNTPGGYITIPSRGSVGIVGYSPVPFWCGPLCYRIASNSDDLDTRFLFYALKARQRDIVGLQQTGSIPALNKKELATVRVPFPPIEVQREIVRVLDTFTELEAELEAELKARRSQYEYYRDALMSYDADTARWVAMADAGVFFGGLTGKSKSDFSNGNHRFVSYMNVFSNISVDLERDDHVVIKASERQRELQRGDVLFTGSSESAAEVGMSSVVTRDPREPVHLNSFSIGYRLHDPDLLDPEFAKHLFRARPLRQQIVKTASGVTRFNVSKARFAKVVFPVPSRADQSRVARVLDDFEALANDASVGLPAELAARRKQYNFYRGRLLTFKEWEA